MRGLIHGLRKMARILRVRQIAWTLRWKVLNKIGTRHQCYICGHRLRQFYPHRPTLKLIHTFTQHMDIVGSDVVNFGCPFCRSNDRERHLLLYFDRLNLWQTLHGANVLDVAPERNISERIKACGPKSYFMVDLYPRRSEIQPVDIMDMPYASGSFDFVMCNHVLEHVADDRRALAEIYRVLRPGGLAVLQTPFSTILERTFEDPGISTAELRLNLYGQEDHVRLYGLDLFERIQATGLRLKLCRHNDVASSFEARFYGMNPQEDLIFVRKCAASTEMER